MSPSRRKSRQASTITKIKALDVEIARLEQKHAEQHERMCPQITALQDASDALEMRYYEYQSFVSNYIHAYRDEDWVNASRAYGTLLDYRCTISANRARIADALSRVTHKESACLAKIEREVRYVLDHHYELTKVRRSVSCHYMPGLLLGSKPPFMTATARWNNYTEALRDQDMKIWLVCHQTVLRPLNTDMETIYQALFSPKNGEDEVVDEDEDQETDDGSVLTMALAIFACALITALIVTAAVAVLADMYASSDLQLDSPMLEPFISVNCFFVIIGLLMNFGPDITSFIPDFSQFKFDDFSATDTADEINWASASELLDSIGTWRRSCKLLQDNRHKTLTSFPAPPAYDCLSSDCIAGRDSRALKDTCPCGIQIAFLMTRKMNLRKERCLWHSDRFSACKGDQQWKEKADEVFKVVNGMLQESVPALDPVEITKGVNQWRKAAGKPTRSVRRSSK